MEGRVNIPVSTERHPHPTGAALNQGLDRHAAWAAALKAFEKVRIPEAARRLRQYPHELSAGRHQRVMIDATLSCRPEFFIADEPTTALDVTT